MKDLGLLEILRYALSGGIGIAVTFLTYPAAVCSVRGMDAAKETTLILGSVLLIGTLIYNVHRAMVFPFFLRYIGFIVRCSFSWTEFAMVWRPIEPELEADRWRWKHQEEDRKRWDEWGAQTHSLYCAAWAMGLALIIGGCFWWPPNRRAILLFSLLFVITVFAGIVNNYRLMYSIAAEAKHH